MAGQADIRDRHCGGRCGWCRRMAPKRSPRRFLESISVKSLTLAAGLFKEVRSSTAGMLSAYVDTASRQVTNGQETGEEEAPD